MLSTLRPPDDDHNQHHLLRVSSSSSCKRRMAPPAAAASTTCSGTGSTEECPPEPMEEEVVATDTSSHSDCSSSSESPDSPSSSTSSSISWEIVDSPSSGPTEEVSSSAAATEADADIVDDSSSMTMMTTSPSPTPTASGDADTDPNEVGDSPPAPSPTVSPVPPLEEEEEEVIEEVGGEILPLLGCDSETIVVSPDHREEEDAVAAAPIEQPAFRIRERYNLGMVNLGNTCYLNSAMQMLVSMGDFVRDLEAYDEAAAEVEERMKEATAKMRMNESSESDEGDEADVDTANYSPEAGAGEDVGADNNSALTDGEKEEKEKPSLRRELLRLARSLRLARPMGTDGDDTASSALSLSAVSAVDPSDFKGAVDRLSCLFEGYRQQDSHEFLSTVLDLLQDEILEEEKRRKEFMGVGEGVEEEAEAESEGGEGGNEDESSPTDSLEAGGTSRNSSSGEDGVVEEEEEEEEEKGAEPVGDDEAVSLKGGCRCPPREGSGAVVVDGASSRNEQQQQLSTSFSEFGTEDISFLLGNNDDNSGRGGEGTDIPQDVTVCTRRQEEKLKIPRTGELERSSSSSSSSSSSYATPTGLPLLLGGRMTTLATPGLFSSAWIPSPPAKLRPIEAASAATSTSTDHHSEEVVPSTEGPAEGRQGQGAVPPTNDDADSSAPRDRGADIAMADDGSNGPRPREERPDENETMEGQEGKGDDDDDAPSTPHVGSSDCCEARAGNTGTEADVSSSTTVSLPDAVALRSPVEKHFGALVEVRLVCDSCSYTRTKTELYRYFSVDILPPATPNLTGGNGDDDEGDGDDGRVATVEEGLRSFFAPERIELKCEKCFCENATEYKEIVRLPSALLLHVKRFIVDYSPIRGVSFRKDKSRVEFGDDVDLNPYCCRDSDSSSTDVHQVEADDEEFSTSTATTKDAPSPPGSECEDGDDSSSSSSTPSLSVSPAPSSRYTLKSVVHHIGSSASCGHYTADGIRLVAAASTPPPVEIDAEEGSERNVVTGYENRWLHFDDGYVTEVSSNDNEETTLLGPTAQGTAYMVMYELAK